MNTVLRLLGWSLASVLVLTVVGLTGFYLWLNAYLKGDDFRSLVSTKTSEALQLKGDFLPFYWSGFSVHSDGFFGKGSASPIASARADQVRADLNARAILNGIWSVPRIDIQSLTLDIDPNASTAAPAATAEPAPTPSPAFSPSFLTRLLPRKVELDTIAITRATITVRTTPPVTLNDVGVTLSPEGNAWNIAAAAGKLKHPDWPQFTLKKARLRSAESQLYLTQVDLLLNDSGLITLSGDVATQGSAPINLRADVQRTPVTAFLTSDWRARLTGNLNGQVNWTGDLRGPQAVCAAGNLNLIDGRIQALPFLNQIASLTKTEELRSLKLHKASADFIYIPRQERLEIYNLLLESEGLVRLQGKFTVHKDIINGQFALGTVPSVLKFVPGAESQVFTEKRDGYIWSPLNLSGPVESPTEDLTPKLKVAAVNSIGESANQGLQQVIDAAKSLLPF